MGRIVGPARGGCFTGGESKRHGDIRPEQLSGYTEGFGDTQGFGPTSTLN